MSEEAAKYDVPVQAFALRLPTKLHSKIAAAAKTKSMNAVIVDRLQTSFEAVGKLLANVDLPPVVRLKSLGNTEADTSRLLEVIELLNVERLVLAARADDLNGAVLVLVAIADGSHFTVIHDHSYINMARRPRMLDVQKLLLGLEGLGLENTVEYVPRLVPDTREIPAGEASAIITKKTLKFDTAEFLKVFAQHDAFDASEYTNVRPKARKKS